MTLAVYLTIEEMRRIIQESNPGQAMLIEVTPKPSEDQRPFLMKLTQIDEETIRVFREYEIQRERRQLSLADSEDVGWCLY